MLLTAAHYIKHYFYSHSIVVDLVSHVLLTPGFELSYLLCQEMKHNWKVASVGDFSYK